MGIPAEFQQKNIPAFRFERDISLSGGAASVAFLFIHVRIIMITTDKICHNENRRLINGI